MLKLYEVYFKTRCYENRRSHLLLPLYSSQSQTAVQMKADSLQGIENLTGSGFPSVWKYCQNIISLLCFTWMVGSPLQVFCFVCLVNYLQQAAFWKQYLTLEHEYLVHACVCEISHYLKMGPEGHQQSWCLIGCSNSTDVEQILK